MSTHEGPPEWGAAAPRPPRPSAAAPPLPPLPPLPPRSRWNATGIVPPASVVLGAAARAASSALSSTPRPAPPLRPPVRLPAARVQQYAEIAEGFVVLRSGEARRALARLDRVLAGHGPAAVLSADAEGIALAEPGADAVAAVPWDRVAELGVGTVGVDVRRVRAITLRVLTPRRVAPADPAADLGDVRTAARAAARAVAERAARAVPPKVSLLPLVVVVPGRLGWSIAGDAAFADAYRRLRSARAAAAPGRHP